MGAGPVRGDFLEELGPAGLCRKGRIWSAGVPGEGSCGERNRGKPGEGEHDGPTQRAGPGRFPVEGVLPQRRAGHCCFIPSASARECVGYKTLISVTTFLKILGNDSAQTFRVKLLVALAQCGTPSGSISLPPTRSSTATQKTWSARILCSSSKRRRPHTPTSHLRKKLKNEKRS